LACLYSMSAFTSLVDNRPYHRVCTHALVQKQYWRFERGVQYGFAIAEPQGKAAVGHTVRLCTS
jgi:hypothetical protein